jgi:hypothetical protein
MHTTAPIDWMFRSRLTGKLTAGQAPNGAALLWGGALVLERMLGRRRPAGRAFGTVGTVVLVAWALSEILEGVNPFRRLLGAGVLLCRMTALARS